MLRQECTTYQGRYYKIKDSRIRPPALQKPRPPLTIVATGRSSLKIAAKYANKWNSFGAFGLSSQESLAITR
jgi:alkanesulfonate monooxygenase SsuD/methylene tetrahydromethanopterin reductase-like flavin-dependent oxidoreductase (luciferase family)